MDGKDLLLMITIHLIMIQMNMMIGEELVNIITLLL